MSQLRGGWNTSHLILVGLPGVGKTTIGKEAASRLDRRFIDFDDEVERSFNQRIPEIFAHYGESAFRAAETELSRYLISTPPAILAPGGGWAANPSAVAHLRPIGRIIYLRVSPQEALRRIGPRISHRPLFSAGPPGTVMQQLYDTRRTHYETIADLIIDTETLGCNEVVTQIVELYKN